jgi:hypothetical protein
MDTHDHILPSQIRDPPNLEGQVPVLISPGKRWPSYIPRHWIPFLSLPTTRRATVEVFKPTSTQGIPHCQSQSQSQNYVTTDRQSASLSWNKAPVCRLRPDLYYCLTVTGFLMWGVLSDERTGLSFARVTVNSSKSVVRMYNLLFTCY